MLLLITILFLATLKSFLDLLNNCIKFAFLSTALNETLLTIHFHDVAGTQFFYIYGKSSKYKYFELLKSICCKFLTSSGVFHSNNLPEYKNKDTRLHGTTCLNLPPHNCLSNGIQYENPQPLFQSASFYHSKDPIYHLGMFVLQHLGGRGRKRALFLSSTTSAAEVAEESPLSFPHLFS